MEDKIKKFYDYLTQLLQGYQKLADTLRDKMTAVEEDNLDSLAGIMKDEQVIVMVSRGFDENIRMHCEAIGLQNGTLSEILAQLPPEWQGRFHQLSLELRSKIDEVKSLNEHCQAQIQEKLDFIAHRMSEIGPGSKPSYSPDKQLLKEPKTSLFDQSI